MTENIIYEDDQRQVIEVLGDGFKGVRTEWKPGTPEAVDEQHEANDQILRQQAHDSLPALRASIDTLNIIAAKANADISPRDTKDLARELRRTNRQLLTLARLFVGALDSTDTGTD